MRVAQRFWQRVFAEVNFIWAIHQVMHDEFVRSISISLISSYRQAHHSAEDFTMPSALRQALLQPFTAWVRNEITNETLRKAPQMS